MSYFHEIVDEKLKEVVNTYGAFNIFEKNFIKDLVNFLGEYYRYLEKIKTVQVFADEFGICVILKKDTFKRVPTISSEEAAYYSMEIRKILRFIQWEGPENNIITKCKTDFDESFKKNKDIFFELSTIFVAIQQELLAYIDFINSDRLKEGEHDADKINHSCSCAKNAISSFFRDLRLFQVDDPENILLSVSFKDKLKGEFMVSS